MKKRIYMLIVIVILLISETYAWFLSSGNIETKATIDMDYSENAPRNLSVVSSEFEMDIYRYDKATKSYIKCNHDEPFLFEGLVPGEIVPFRIRFKNFSAYAQSGVLYLKGITITSVEEIDDPFDKLIVSMAPGNGYTNNPYLDVQLPESVFVKLNEAEDNGQDKTLILYSNLPIPVSNISNSNVYDDYVELQCYFWLDTRAGNEFQGAIFTIENIIFVI